MGTQNLPQVSKKIPKEDKYFSSDWVKKFYTLSEDIREKTYIMYHIETGLRVSDVMTSEWVHVDWANMRTYTYDHKKDSWRWIYFNESVKSQLKQWLLYKQKTGIKSKRIFDFGQKTANRILKRVAIRLGHPYGNKVSSHWCRHTFIRLSRAVGRDIIAVQQNTGDTLKTLLEWYSKLDAESMTKEIQNKPLIGD